MYGSNLEIDVPHTEYEPPENLCGHYKYWTENEFQKLIIQHSVIH